MTANAWRGLRGRMLLGVILCAPALAIPGPDRLADADFGPRRQAGLEHVAARPLRQGPNPGTWVDVERWCIAHARLALNTDAEAIAQANQYLASVEWVSLWHGLVADTGIQVTDLLRTWFEFQGSGRLTPDAETHLRHRFAEWEPPNRDRNRFAELEYHWPAEYTENHTLNILTAAYLIDTLLERDRTHRQRLLQRFLHDRALRGWSEFYSPNYAIFTAKPLALLSEFAPDDEIRQAATMMLDLLVVDFATHSLGPWRGMPFSRGSAAGANNSQNSMMELARHWFGDQDPNVRYQGGTALVHLLTSRYRPPAMAQRLLKNPGQRGHYTIRQTATHGPARLRVPIVAAVTPQITMASAPGHGSYYDGHYWSISFASAPGNVITAPRSAGRNLVQIDNVMAVTGPIQVAGRLDRQVLDQGETGLVVEWFAEGDARLVIIELDTDVRLFLLEYNQPLDGLADRLRVLDGAWEDGTVSWTRPQDGQRVRMVNRRDGAGWRLESVWRDGALYRLDHGCLHDSPYLRSKRDSARFHWRDSRESWIYDLSEPSRPQATRGPRGGFPALPPEQLAGPLPGMIFMRIPSGEYPAGARGDEGRMGDEPFAWRTTPAFYLARTEITVAQYRAFLDANPDSERLPGWYYRDWGKTDQHPQTLVSWRDAVAFCEWLTATYPGQYRLPTETEWEKAARGWQYRVYPWGDTYDGTQSGTLNGEYAPVGAKTTDRSPFDILDMAGNAWEWCADAYPHPRQEAWRRLRGCGWNYDPDTFRIAYRSGWEERGRSPHIGFRVVHEPE